VRLGRDLLRRRSLAVAVLVAVAALGAWAYCATADKRYDARAELLVSPVAANDATFAGIELLRDSGDPKRALQTVARLVRTPEVAEAVRLELGTRESRGKLLGSVSAHPVHGSDLVAVIGRSPSPQRAAQIANAFAAELVAQRTVRFRSEVLQAINRLRAQVGRARAGSPETAALVRRLAVLRGVAGMRDPTIQVASSAVPPRKPAWPRPWLLIPLAAAGALALGALALLTEGLLRSRRPAAGLVAARDLPGREAVLKRRVQAVTRAEREVARRAGELAARERELAGREGVPAPAPEPVAEERAAGAPREVDGAWNLNELQRLVEARRGEFPERADEWSAYLFHLREHAAADGRLPRSFDALVEESFGELIRF
jgi:capsular polysaccharide biosynthesis protein